MTPTEAADIARDALIWLAGEPETLGRVLAETGLAPADLRDRAGDPDFLGLLLERLLADERTVLAFAVASGLPRDALLRARAALPGGQALHWT